MGDKLVFYSRELSLSTLSVMGYLLLQAIRVTFSNFFLQCVACSCDGRRLIFLGLGLNNSQATVPKSTNHQAFFSFNFNKRLRKTKRRVRS